MNNRKNHIEDKGVKNFPVSSEELCCPACEISLARHPHPRTDVIEGCGNAATAMRNEIREIRAGKFRDAELIVAAPCGHIYHRFCLRHYCFIYQQAHNTENVECPVCMQEVSMVKFQTIDLKAHLRAATKSEKMYTETAFMNEELHQQKVAAEELLNQSGKTILEGRIKLEACRGHQESMSTKKRSLKMAIDERNRLRGCIEKCNQGIDSMHKENLNIIKMYLSIMKDQPEDVLLDKRIPQPLIPYLAIILADEGLVKKFGEILKPVEIDGIKSNAELLIKEILADVGSKSSHCIKGKSKLGKLYTTLKSTEKPVVVKVQRSMVSIFSRSVLDQECLKSILLEVKGPINKLHDAHHKLATKQKKRNDCVRRSVSDIQVLFEARRKQHESGSAPPLDSDTEFLKTIPPRRCKSTEPILIKAKRKKPVVVKVNEMKQLEHSAVGDGNGSNPAKQEINSKQQSLDVSKSYTPHPPSPKSSRSSSLHNPKEEVNYKISSNDCGQFTKAQFQLTTSSANKAEEFQRQNSSAGFIPSASGSVFTMIYGDDGNDNNHLTSLVDDVSKITFNACKMVPCQNIEDDGNVNQPLIEYSVLLPKKVSTHANANFNLVGNDQPTSSKPKANPSNLDIESAMRESELSHRSSGRSTSKTQSGPLQGILPGPYFNPKTDSQQSTLPVYQSRWLTMLPSTRTDINNSLQSDRHNWKRHDPPANLRQVEADYERRGYEIDKGDQNQPHGDSYRVNINSLKHTVIDIPSSNTMINLPPIRNNHLMACQLQKPKSSLHLQPYPSGNMAHYEPNSNITRYQHNWRQSRHRISTSDLKSSSVNLSQQNYWSRGISHQPQRLPLSGQCLLASGEHYSNPGHLGMTMPTSTRAAFVEDALVQLCRGLSPPQSPRNRNISHINICHADHKTYQTFPFMSMPVNHQHTTTMVVSDGRAIRRARKRQHIHV